ncbi:hypothetical protein JTE90_001746 [Oedothorax gibbosus]|uniref:RING-type E3 ubiquitin transferase n=1 Tax=Oedothorax gibbosus TaxID=931172 RepID=A0AAV6V624_9ARAC|nr:hypothetical protein JTE90_001746 [Oedothorax gibbosus]
MAEAPSNNSQGPICHFFLNSTCRYGNKCRFSHRLPTPPEDGICKYYLKGYCRFGRKCWNRHEPSTSNGELALPTSEDNSIPKLCESFARGQPCDAACAFMHGDPCPDCGEARLHPLDPSQRITHIRKCAEDKREARVAQMMSADKACGICLEVVCEKVEASARKFGVLESCDHVFCFECIMRWRKVKEDTSEAVSLSCPLCRTPSSFVAPCRAWPSSATEKRRLIAERRAALRARPCAAFSRWGHCPRGALCLHHHRQTRKTARDLSPPPSFHLPLPGPDLDLMESLLLLDLMDEEYFSSDSDLDPEDYFLLQDMDLEILGSALDFW